MDPIPSIPVLPKVVLHDHLDGGVRPATIIELASAAGYAGLPATSAEDLAGWFDQSRSGSLARYLEAFEHTVAVMQTPDALERIAREAVEDWHASGVVYGEVRFAPSLHMKEGLSRATVIEAVLRGLASGSEETGVRSGLIIDAMRQEGDSAEVAREAAAYRDRGVVGFDLAGPEAGFPASRHAEALEIAGNAGLHITIHAGEAAGPESILDALECGAERIGHGVRVVEDAVVRDGRIVSLGAVAQRVYDERVPLEICPWSNVHTGAARSPAEHPVGPLYRRGFTVTLSPDNRLMSATSMVKEFEFVVGHHGFTLSDLRAVTLAATEAAFCDDATRREVRDRVEAGYAAV